MAPPEEQTSAPAEGEPVLPIEGYDELTVPQVVAKLPDLSDEELGAVQAYEERNQNRKGIVNWIRPEPSADADDGAYTRAELLEGDNAQVLVGARGRDVAGALADADPEETFSAGEVKEAVAAYLSRPVEVDGEVPEDGGAE